MILLQFTSLDKSHINKSRLPWAPGKAPEHCFLSLEFLLFNGKDPSAFLLAGIQRHHPESFWTRFYNQSFGLIYTLRSFCVRAMNLTFSLRPFFTSCIFCWETLVLFSNPLSPASFIFSKFCKKTVISSIAHDSLYLKTDS